jgi:hypothetical protein
MKKNNSPAAIRARVNAPWNAPAPVASGDLIARTALQLIAEGLPAHPAAIRARVNAPVPGADRPVYRASWGPSARYGRVLQAFAACEWDRPTLQGWLVADTSTPDGATREK